MDPMHVTWMILRDGDRVLLGHKKRGFGAGYLNGVGGKVDPGETVEQAAVRETEEEIGVKVTQYEKVATIIFDDLFYKGTRKQTIMHCFIGTKWQGELIETEEIEPEWFTVDQIPYDKMWVDDKYWLPQVIAGKKVEGRFKFTDDYKLLGKIVKVIK
ncbi:8-oxo-dGTP diphosphatase [Candidatus Saccharibacteria bacterium]|nr:8-oxo-dGTP diphosphatase [Candidatus Saccharibacteria bacterium]